VLQTKCLCDEMTTHNKYATLILLSNVCLTCQFFRVITLGQLPQNQLLGAAGAAIYTGCMSFLSSNQQRQSTEGKCDTNNKQ